MSVGSRLKEERLRLGLTQTQMAALAGASKGAQINWEKDSSSPPASALLAYAGAGADVQYVLFGERPEDRRADTLLDIREQLASCRQRLIDPDSPSGNVGIQKSLQAMLKADAMLLTPELREEAELLLSIVGDEDKLREFRAAEATAHRARKDQQRRRLVAALEGIDPLPNDTVSYLLLQLAVDHGVPTRTLADLWEEIQGGRGAASMRPNR